MGGIQTELSEAFSSFNQSIRRKTSQQSLRLRRLGLPPYQREGEVRGCRGRGDAEKRRQLRSAYESDLVEPPEDDAALLQILASYASPQGLIHRFSS